MSLNRGEKNDNIGLLFIVSAGLLAFILMFIIGHAVYLECFKPVARIDFEVSDQQQEKPFDIYVIPDRGAKFPSERKLNWCPWWMKDRKVYGRVFESNQAKAHLDIHVYKPCEMAIKLLGSDMVDTKGRRLNPKVTYSSFIINDNETLSGPKTVWHDRPFEHKLKVDPGLVKIDIYWHRPID